MHNDSNLMEVQVLLIRVRFLLKIKLVKALSKLILESLDRKLLATINLMRFVGLILDLFMLLSDG